MGVKVKEKIPGSEVFWIFIDHNGRRKAKKVGSKDAALKAKALIEVHLVLGNSALPEAKPAATTIEVYFKRFEKSCLDTSTVRDSSRRNYRSTFSHHILPELKSERLDEINREDVQQMKGPLFGRILRKTLSGSFWQTSAVS
jgi:integrase